MTEQTGGRATYRCRGKQNTKQHVQHQQMTAAANSNAVRLPNVVMQHTGVLQRGKFIGDFTGQQQGCGCLSGSGSSGHQQQHSRRLDAPGSLCRRPPVRVSSSPAYHHAISSLQICLLASVSAASDCSICRCCSNFSTAKKKPISLHALFAALVVALLNMTCVNECISTTVL